VKGQLEIFQINVLARLATKDTIQKDAVFLDGSTNRGAAIAVNASRTNVAKNVSEFFVGAVCHNFRESIRVARGAQPLFSILFYQSRASFLPACRRAF
jgi:hypothetical protein